MLLLLVFFIAPEANPGTLAKNVEQLHPNWGSDPENLKYFSCVVIYLVGRFKADS